MQPAVVEDGINFRQFVRTWYILLVSEETPLIIDRKKWLPAMKQERCVVLVKYSAYTDLYFATVSLLLVMRRHPRSNVLLLHCSTVGGRETSFDIVVGILLAVTALHFN